MTPSVPAITSGWENFFVAQVGAAAALTGLVFVAVSISLPRILASTHLPQRAAEALIVFLGVLLVGMLGLVPNQDAPALGYEVAGIELLVWVGAVRRHLRAHRDPNLESEARRWLWVRVLGAQVATVPFLVGGALLIARREHALGWVAAGVVMSFVVGAFNAWVLLVEIQREKH